MWVGIWQMSWPMLLIMIFNFFVGITDIYVAGLIDPKVQAAIGYVTQLYFLVIIIANAVSIGTLALISRAIGAGNFSRATEVAKQSILFSILVAILLSLFFFAFYREIIAFAGFPPEIRGIAEDFLRVFLFVLGPNYVLLISNAIFRASGEVLKPLATMLVVSMLNIAGDFAFVFGYQFIPAMGFVGIAISTACATTIGMVLNMGFFCLSRWRSMMEGPLAISMETIKSIVDIGWPSALLQIAWNFATILIYNLLSRLEESIVALAAIANGLRIEAIIFLPAFALNMAASVLIGQNLGANRPDRAEMFGWRIALIGVGIMTVMSSLIFIMAYEIAGLFTQVPAVLNETVRYLRINMLVEPFLGLSMILGGGLQGAGDTRGPMRVIVFCMWIIRLPLAAFLAFTLNYGATGVWVAMISSMFFQGFLMSRRFQQGKWKHLKIE